MINYFYIIFSFFIWSTYGIILNKININPIAFTFITTFVGFVFMAIYIFLKNIKLKIEKKYYFTILITTLLFLANAITFFYSYQLTSISNAIFSHYLAPIFVSIFSVIFLKEKFEKLTFISLVIALIGMYFIFFSNKSISIHNKDIYGIIFGIISAICYGSSMVIAKSIIHKVNYIVFIFYQGVFISIFFIAALVLKTSLFKFDFNIIWLIVLIGITHSFIAPMLYLKGLTNIKAQFAGLLGYTEVAASILLGILFLKEVPTIITLVGGLLIVFSGGLVLYYGKDN